MQMSLLLYKLHLRINYTVAVDPNICYCLHMEEKWSGQSIQEMHFPCGNNDPCPASIFNYTAAAKICQECYLGLLKKCNYMSFYSLYNPLTHKTTIAGQQMILSSPLNSRLTLLFKHPHLFSSVLIHFALNSRKRNTF